MRFRSRGFADENVVGLGAAGPGVLLTGATGFVGMELLGKLLARSDRDVVALVRAPDSAGARERLYGVLERIGAEQHVGRVHAVAGDITLPGLGLTDLERDSVAGRISAIVHCAASVSFSLPLEESRAINVEGTRRVLDLADRVPWLERLVHVSTAYVAGTFEGRFGECDLDRAQGFRNAYEQSKAEAESLIRSRPDLPVSVVRPSIVVGNSKSGWTSAFNVVYFPLQAFARGLTAAVPADPEAIVDIVPVDHVADGILAALDAPDMGTVNLVAGDRAVRVGELAELAGRYFDRPVVQLVKPEEFADASPVLEQMEVYFPYFSVRARFDDARAQALGLQAPLLTSYFDRLMDFAVATRWGKRQPPRMQAVA